MATQHLTFPIALYDQKRQIRFIFVVLLMGVMVSFIAIVMHLFTTITMPSSLPEDMFFFVISLMGCLYYGLRVKHNKPVLIIHQDSIEFTGLQIKGGNVLYFKDITEIQYRSGIVATIAFYTDNVNELSFIEQLFRRATKLYTLTFRHTLNGNTVNARQVADMIEQALHNYQKSHPK